MTGITAVLGIVMVVFGRLIKTWTDIHKITVRQFGGILVWDGILRRAGHIKPLDDLVRCSSCAVIAGPPWT